MYQNQEHIEVIKAFSNVIISNNMEILISSNQNDQAIQTVY